MALPQVRPLHQPQPGRVAHTRPVSCHLPNYLLTCSFDIIRDELGGPRSTFPHTLSLVAGTQAASAKLNYIAFVKLSKLGQGRHGKKAEQVRVCGHMAALCTREDTALLGAQACRRQLAPPLGRALRC